MYLRLARSARDGTSRLANSLSKLLLGNQRVGLLSFILAILLALPCAMLMPVLDREEAIIATATSDMIENHIWTLPSYQLGFDEEAPPHLGRPVGIHWFQSLSVKATSDVTDRDILPYRWPSLIGIGLSAFALAWGVKRTLSLRIALMSGVMAGLSFLPSTYGLIATSDSLGSAFLFLMMASLARLYGLPPKRPALPDTPTDIDLSPPVRNAFEGPSDPPSSDLMKERVILWLSFAFGLMILGPIICLYLGLTLATLIVWDHRTHNSLGWLNRLCWDWGLFILLAIFGPWAVAVTIQTDGTYWQNQWVLSQSMFKDARIEWPFALIVLLPIALFPASYFLGSGLLTAINHHEKPAIRMAIAWTIPALLVCSFMPNATAGQFMPALGGIIWLMAASTQSFVKQAESEPSPTNPSFFRDTPLAIWANLILGLLASLIICAAFIALLMRFGAPMIGFVACFCLVISGVVLAGLGAFKWARAQGSNGLSLLFLAGLLFHLSAMISLTQIKSIWLSKSMERALIVTGLDPRQGVIDGPVCVIGLESASFRFLMGSKTQFSQDISKAISAYEEHRPVYVNADKIERFEAALKAADRKPIIRAVVSGYDYSAGQKRVMRLYHLD